MSDDDRSTQDQDDDAPLAGTAPTPEEQEELESGGNAAEVVERKGEPGPARTTGA